MNWVDDDLVCACSCRLKFYNGIFRIDNENVDKCKYADYYKEEYYKSSLYDYTSYRLERIVALARPVEGKRILDLGCGPGGIAVRCALKGAEVIGIDVSEDALRLSAQRAARSNAKLLLFEFDGKEIPFVDSAFDSIILSDVVEHVDDQTLNCLLKECNRLLKPDGRVVIHTSPTKNIILLTKMLSKLSLNKIDLYSRLITPEYEHLHIRYHNAKSLGDLLRRNGFYSAMWGEFQYLQTLPRFLKRIKSLSDQLWCLAFKDPKLLEAAGSRPYLIDTPAELKMGSIENFYINYGLYEAEDGFRWTAKIASFFILIKPESSKLILELSNSQPEVEAKIMIGDHEISRFMLKRGIHLLAAPLRGIPSGIQEMKIELDRAFIPKEEGINQDNRELGVALFKVKVE